jgi:Ca2+-transporting ATPase
MRRSPRSATESIFGGGTTAFIAIFGGILSVMTLAVGFGLWDTGDETWQSVLFTALVFGQLGLALEVRSEKRSLVTIGLATNKAMLGAVGIGIVAHLCIIYVPFLQHVFGTVALDAGHLGIAIGGTFIVMASVEAYKWVLRRRTAA